MTRVLKLLLPICILLLSGNVQSYRHSSEGSVCFSLPKISKESFPDGCMAASNCSGISFRSALSDTERANRLNRQAKLEEKEDELAPLRKSTGFSTDFALAFYTQSPGKFTYFIRPCLFFYKRVFCFPSCKSLFLKLKVFRI
jgi:hypothetical protein